MHKKLALALFLAVAAPHAACSHPKPPDVVVQTDDGNSSEGLTVTGTATIAVAPDCADLTITIWREADRPGLALKLVRERQDELVAGLQKIGLAAADIRLSHVTVDPVYDWVANGRSVIRTYESRVTITATTRRFEQIATVMDAATQAGATSIATRFRKEDLEPLKQEVRAKAIAAAQAKAKEITTALGVQLGPPIVVVEANPSYLWTNAYFPTIGAGAGELGGEAQPLTVDVTITYAI